MLFPLPIESISPLVEKDPIWKLTLGGRGLEKLAYGMYDGGFNLGNILSMLRDGEGKPPWKVVSSPLMEEHRKHLEEKGRFPEPDEFRSDYGVADDLDQIRAYYKSEIEDPQRYFVIGVTPVEKDPDNAGKGGGWRWHKWGPYIGTQDPQCEYLDDEPEIDKIFVFSLYELRDPE